jgi:hypothetical protein
MGSALVGSCSPAFSPAGALPFSDSEEIERLQRQTVRAPSTDDIIGFTSLRNYLSDAMPGLAQTRITDGF